MGIEEFYKKMREAVEQYSLPDTDIFLQSGYFLTCLNKIISDETRDENLKMTCLSILFEGFYRFIDESNPLKKVLSGIRLERWSNHFGTPSITFLLTYNTQIEKTRNQFSLAASQIDETSKPWEISKSENFQVDQQNSVYVDVESVKKISMPIEGEKTGQFLKTHNPSGGFTTTPCDPVSQKFIEYASEVAKQDGTVLEIGAGFGAASLEALANGAKVFCNDIETANLAVVRNRYMKNEGLEENSVTGDDSKLVFIPGTFPEELAGLPKNYFDAILICRVLHFFKGEKIEQSLEQLLPLLKPGAKLFIVCETPFLKNWQRFIPEFERRVSEGKKWPGEITNPADYESSGRAESLPKFVHWITKEVLERTLMQTKFGVEHISYINRCGQFPKDLLLDGRESIGAVAARPNL